MGNANSGHYYSLISDRSQSKDNQWYEFNDTEVDYFDKDNIPNEAFGGIEDTWQNRKFFKRQKIKNAYVLIYERIKHQAKEVKVVDMEQSLASAEKKKPKKEPKEEPMEIEKKTSKKEDLALERKSSIDEQLLIEKKPSLKIKRKSTMEVHDILSTNPNVP